MPSLPRRLNSTQRSAAKAALANVTETTFRLADKNNDGQLSPCEIQTAPESVLLLKKPTFEYKDCKNEPIEAIRFSYRHF